jgi:endoglycosylceramidase
MGVKRYLGMLVAVGLFAAIGASGCGIPPGAELGPVGPLSHDGRWLIDTTGRVVTLHGVNEVAKSAPYYPAAFGFGADDAEFLADYGFSAVRLGVEFQGLMPQPGQISQAYIDGLATTVQQLADHKIYVLLDFHQDGFGPKYTGNGFPEWMSLDDGLSNPPDSTFPTYYITNPALQRAFESFWANRIGPGGVGLQDRFVAGLTAVVQRFDDQPYVMGYELMNEPWPGANWGPCIQDAAVCAQMEHDLLRPFYDKATAAVRAITTTQQVYVEPFVLFNFGYLPTSIPGAGSNDMLSWHSYALDVPHEESVVDFAVAAGERDGVPPVATEFGATMDVATLDRLTGQMDGGIVSWMFWAYNEEIITNRSGPASIARVRDQATFAALVRPYPLAVTGTPTATNFDPATNTYTLTYSTTGPSGRTYPAELDTVVSVPDLQYPDGYQVAVTGATITSVADAEALTLRTNPGCTTVTLTVTPA